MGIRYRRFPLEHINHHGCTIPVHGKMLESGAESRNKGSAVALLVLTLGLHETLWVIPSVIPFCCIFRLIARCLVW